LLWMTLAVAVPAPVLSYGGRVTTATSDPSLAVAVALATLRCADDVAWSSDLAAAFRLRLGEAERLVSGVGVRVACAEAAITRLAAAA
jgi:hypothetical protein